MNRFFISMMMMTVLGIVSCGSGEVKTAKSGLSTDIDTNAIYYNSRDRFCKSPFGAVEQGTKVTFRILAKTDDLEKVTLIITKSTIFGNNDYQKEAKFTNLEMAVVGKTNEQSIYQTEITIGEIGVYGYSFELQKNSNDTIVYADNGNSVEVPYVKINGTGGIGRFHPLGKTKIPYVLTVYTNNFTVPSWSEDMVIYYIFPERFKNGNKENDPKIGVRKFYGQKDIEFHTNWNDPYPFVPGPNDGNKTDDSEYCNDFYGGDIEGIIQKLDYIKSLGVNVIYINPIFRAPSNHKYDTADYMNIDEAFGDMEIFQTLVDEAGERGIRIILDTSLNHCGSDSVYMDRYGKYETYGAFEGEVIRKDSPYYDWFEWNEKATAADQKYAQWANPTLANLKEVESYKDFAYRKEDSVMKFWLSKGIGGWRMDVTPWVSDEFWRDWRGEIKKDYPEALTISEVWFDASKYLIGDMYDATMNYIFRSAALNFARGGDAKKSYEALAMIQENYPRPAFYRCMNLLSGHDLPRAMFEIGYKKYGDNNFDAMRKRLLLAFALQFTLPGAPTIYYGDEIGMTGGHDPFNRGPYPWKEDGGDYGDHTLIKDSQNLAKIRSDNPVFVKGDLSFLYNDKNILSFERTDKKTKAIVIMNNADSAKEVVLERSGKFTDLLTKKTVEIKNGTPIQIGAVSTMILITK